METVTLLNDRPLQSVRGGPNSTEATRTLAVTATYVLTEEGRKALLLAGRRWSRRAGIGGRGP